MQIFQHHTTAKDKNLYMCYKNIILGEKNGIASHGFSVQILWVVRNNAFRKPTFLVKP